MIKQENQRYETASKALIYPGSTIAGYGHIFSLGIAGIDVVALSSGRCPNFHSRYVKEKYIVPNPLDNHESFVEWLVDYGKKQPCKPVLFLAEDVYAYIASLYKDELSPYYLYPYIPLEKLGVFFNKKEMLQTAVKNNILVPYTLYSPLTSEQISEWDNFPVVIKPLVSRFTFEGRKLLDAVKFPKLFGGKAVQASNTEEIRHFAKKLEQENIEYCIQPFIPGENPNIANIKFVSDKNGNIPSCFVSRKIRQQPADYGTCAVSKSDYIESLHKYAEEFCKATDYAGPGCMEFKWNEADQKWYFIEFNARLDFWMRMSTIKGVNLALQQYLLSTGQDLFHHKQHNGGKYWIDILGDISGLKWRQKKKEWRLSYWKIIKPYFFFDEAVFNRRDPLPRLLTWLKRFSLRGLFGRPRSWLKKTLYYIFKQKNPSQEFSDYDQYWDKRKQLKTEDVIYPRFYKAMKYMHPEFSVLDYGCGSGAFLKMLSSKGYGKLYGSDVYRGADFPENIKFYNNEDLGEDLKFDVITLLQVAEHVQDAEQLIKKLLKSTDKLIISIPNTGYWQHRMRLFFGRMPVTDVVFHVKEHVRFWTKKDFKEMCQEHNWQVKHVATTVPDKSFLSRLMPGFFARQILYVIEDSGK